MRARNFNRRRPRLAIFARRANGSSILAGVGPRAHRANPEDLVYSSQEVWLIAVAALLAGAAVGYFLNRFLRQRPGAAPEQSAQAQLHNLQEEYRHYRQAVTTHFGKTADLVGQLAHAYRDVHNHLARGAQDLCEDPAAVGLKALPEDALTATPAQNTLIEPPRDYAPRSGNGDKGVLDEDFGLEKMRRDHTPEPPRLF